MIIFLWILTNIYLNSAERQGSSAYYDVIYKAMTRHQIYDGDYEIINTFQLIWHPKLLFEFAHGKIRQEINSELILGNNSYLSQIINATYFINSINPPINSSSEGSFITSGSVFSDSYPTSSSTSRIYPSSNSSSDVFSQNSNSSSTMTYTMSSSATAMSSTITSSSPASSSSYSTGSSPISSSASLMSSTTIYSTSNLSTPMSSSSSPLSNISVSSDSTIQPNLPTTLSPIDACFADLEDIGSALIHPRKYNWALQMLDSAGKLPSGILQGAINWYGSYEECFVNVSADERPNINLGSLEGIYLIATFSNSKNSTLLPFPYSTEISIKEALCVPSSCSADTIKEILDLLFTQIIDREPILENLTVNSVVCIPSSLPLDDRAIGVLFLLSVFLLLMFLGTFYDIIHQNFLQSSFKFYSKLNDDTSGNDEILNEPNIVESAYIDNDRKVSISHQPGVIGNILLSFSVYSNGAKILNVNLEEGTLSCIHGIRFLSMSWVILGHSYAFGASNFSDLMTITQYLDQFLFQAIGNAFVSVDSFFLLSGTLVSYSFLKMHEAGKVSWLGYYLHRFWRLTPPYMLILGTYVTLVKYLGNGPLWKYDGMEINYCADSWWYNLLYINNFGDFSTKCMGWSWYLANDMQFYVISPVVLILLVRKNKLGFGAIGILMIATWVTSGIISSVYNLQASSVLDLAKSITFMNEYYIKPYCRIGPYLVGITLGYILHVTKCKYNFKRKWIPWLFWVVAITMNMSIVYGLIRTFDNHPLSREVNALYNSLHRTGWAIGLGWVIFACLTGYAGFVNTILSWKFWIPLSRLSYCAYLIHPVTMYLFYSNQKSLFVFSHFLMVYLFLANLILAYAAAFVFSLAFESPMMGLEKILRSRITKKQDK